MNEQNISILTSLFISISTLLVYGGFLFPRQLNNIVGYPRDGLSRLRTLILVAIVVTAAARVPSIIYLFYRLFGHEFVFLRNFASITSNLSALIGSLLLVLIFTYRYRVNKKK